MEENPKITLITEPNELGSKKRKADDSEGNPYEDMNKQLKELYLMRQKNRELNQSEVNRKPEEVIHIDLDSQESFKASKVDPKKIIEEVKIEPKKQEPERPTLWLNKLRYYPNDYLQDNMVSFREMMYEDLLKGTTY
jgi:hypothetical protein